MSDAIEDSDYPISVLREERDWLTKHHPGPATAGRVAALDEAIASLSRTECNECNGSGVRCCGSGNMCGAPCFACREGTR